jgi:uncharacterized membrane protein
MEKGRLEAFSDGVIAIAITLLVLDIHVPPPGTEGGLAAALGRQWPSYVAYAVSFLTIGIIWINHHAMLRRLREVDHAALALNLLLLMAIGLLPFTTALMAAYLRETSGERLAAAIYGGSLLAMSPAFYGLHQHALSERRKLFREQIDDAARRAILRRNRAGIVPYVLATALAPVSPYITLGITAAIAIYYALPATVADGEA